MIIRVDLKAVVKPFDCEVLRRVPLAEAVLSLWAFVMETEFLDGVFERHRGRSFEDVLTFPVFVELMADALLQHRGSGRQAFERARENDTRLTSVEAACGKSKRPVGSCGACRCRSAKAFWKRERPACASGSRPAIAFASGRRRCVSSRRSSWMAGSSSRWRSGCCWRAAGRGSCLAASCWWQAVWWPACPPRGWPVRLWPIVTAKPTTAN